MNSFGLVECFAFFFATFLTITMQSPTRDQIENKFNSAVANCSAIYNISQEKLENITHFRDLLITRDQKCLLACIGSHLDLFPDNKLSVSAAESLLKGFFSEDYGSLQNTFKLVREECGTVMKSADFCEGVYKLSLCTVATVFGEMSLNPKIRRQTVYAVENCSSYYGVPLDKMQRFFSYSETPSNRNETCIPACLATNMNLMDKAQNKFNFTASDIAIEQFFGEDRSYSMWMGAYQEIKTACQNSITSPDLCDGVYQLYQCIGIKVNIENDDQIIVANLTDYDL